MNVDHSEVEKFNRLAQHWWDPQGPMAPLHALNPLRSNLLCDLVHPQTAKVLDIGCGGGLLSEALAQRGATVTGIDQAATSIQIAKEHATKNNLHIDYQCIASADFAKVYPRSFDLVCCLETLEHVPEPDLLIADCATLVKPGGWVVFSTINRNPKSFLFAIVIAEYVVGLLPKGTHQYRKCITPHELANWCRAVGLTPMQTTGLHYNPFTKRFTSGRDISINYMFGAQAL